MHYKNMNFLDVHFSQDLEKLLSFRCQVDTVGQTFGTHPLCTRSLGYPIIKLSLEQGPNKI